MDVNNNAQEQLCNKLSALLNHLKDMSPDDFTNQINTDHILDSISDFCSTLLESDRSGFDVVLIERPGETGLSLSEVIMAYSKLNDNDAYPMEIFAAKQECSAMGFITRNAANVLDFDYKCSGFEHFIAEILDDMHNETPDGVYTFKDLRIKLTRNI